MQKPVELTAVLLDDHSITETREFPGSSDAGQHSDAPKTPNLIWRTVPPPPHTPKVLRTGRSQHSTLDGVTPCPPRSPCSGAPRERPGEAGRRVTAAGRGAPREWSGEAGGRWADPESCRGVLTARQAEEWYGGHAP